MAPARLGPSSEGRIQAAGPLDEVLTDANLTATFGVPLQVQQEDGRWRARAKRS